MKPALTALALLAVLAAAPASAAETGTAEIEALGRINGLALACQQPAIASRARNAMITTAPRTRANGELFENATQAAYLEHGKGGTCPDVAALAGRLGEAENKLHAAFAGTR
jgi:hypothetical protein